MTNERTAAANKELVRRFYREVYHNWDMSMVSTVLSPRFRSHDWPEGGATGQLPFLAYYAEIRRALPDARYEVDDLIAEDDRVVVRWRLLGTHEGEFRGIPASGRAIALKGIAIYRVEEGKLVDRWVVTDLYGLLQELWEPAAQY